MIFLTLCKSTNCAHYVIIFFGVCKGFKQQRILWTNPIFNLEHLYEPYCFKPIRKSFFWQFSTCHKPTKCCGNSGSLFPLPFLCKLKWRVALQYTTKFPMPTWKSHISILIKFKKLMSYYDPSRHAMIFFA
jgi:hypothetical protein